MHPEQPERLIAIVDQLRASTLAHHIQWMSPFSSRNVLTRYSLGIAPKVLFGLEGDYELESLSLSVLETVKQRLNLNISV